MSEDSKKTQANKKNDPKEQRKPRNSRSQVGKLERKSGKIEESQSVPKVPQKPPVYADPGPEFYKSLKRETEEILKITEEENSKYKKKEIQSNWSKYEMPIESYEEIEEHDVGADYEKLIQAPLSVGGHFQFKHEKSWDTNTGPSLYDKYFDIDMDRLSLAVSTIPFYERNCVEQSLFSETDMLTMNNRATKYKQKYYDDKCYATPETEAHDKILNSLKESLSNNSVDKDYAKIDHIETKSEHIEEDDINLDFKNLAKTDISKPPNTYKKFDEPNENKSFDIKGPSAVTTNNLIIENTHPTQESIVKVGHLLREKDETITSAKQPSKEIKKRNQPPIEPAPESKSIDIQAETKLKDIAVETKINPVIESPEDLEKWLDDFLDG